MNHGFVGWSSPSLQKTLPFLHIEDQKANTTLGGTFTSGAWQTRTLNTVVADTGGIALLSSNQITLPSGTYRVHIVAPASACDRHQARLQNMSDGTTTLLGQGATALLTGLAMTTSFVIGRFSITSATIFEVQHRCQTTRSNDGFGFAMSFGVVEVYTVATFVKEA